MAYSRTIWQNEVTPLDSEHLNNIEDGIEECQVDSDVIDQYRTLGVVFDNPLLLQGTSDDPDER
jgi:hypothetical protein